MRVQNRRCLHANLSWRDVQCYTDAGKIALLSVACTVFKNVKFFGNSKIGQDK